MDTATASPRTRKEPAALPPEPRLVDTASYLAALQELAEEGKSVSVTVSGSSMRPFLTGGRDRVIFRAPERPLRRGDDPPRISRQGD